MHLFDDIYTIDKVKISDKGLKIDNNIEEFVSKLNRTSENAKFKKVKDIFISEDLNIVFEDENYEIIFQPEEIKTEIRGIIKESLLEENIISELKFIKDEFPYTYHHILNVTVLSLRLILHFDNDYDPVSVAHVGLIHDLGKSRINRKILYKNDKLTTQEWELIKTHPAISYLLLLYYPVNYKEESLAASFNHHEKLDGSGYPRGIKKLSKYTRLISPVDMIDALLSSRPYRKRPYTLRAALDCLQEEAEAGKLEKNIVYHFIGLSRRDKPDINSIKVGRKWRDDPPEDNSYGIRG